VWNAALVPAARETSRVVADTQPPLA